MRRPAADTRRSCAGFTLFEALIAVALMGLIMGAIVTVTAQWLPSWNRGLARVQRNEQAAIALDRLVADLSAAQHVSPNRAVKRPLFDGSELSVIFVRTAIGPNVRPGLEIVRIAETVDVLGRVLVRMRAPFVPLPTGDPSVDAIPFADPVVLLRPPLRLSFAYSPGDGSWTNTWKGSSSLPRAIRLVIHDAVGERALAVSTATRVHVNMAAPEPEQAQEAQSPNPPSDRASRE